MNWHHLKDFHLEYENGDCDSIFFLIELKRSIRWMIALNVGYKLCLSQHFVLLDCQLAIISNCIPVKKIKIVFAFTLPYLLNNGVFFFWLEDSRMLESKKQQCIHQDTDIWIRHLSKHQDTDTYCSHCISSPDRPDPGHRQLGCHLEPQILRRKWGP